MQAEVEMLGLIGVSPLDVPGAAALIAARDAAAPFAYVVTLNAQSLVMCADPASPMMAAAQAGWMRLNDSRVVARLQRWVDGRVVPVAPGSDLCVELMAHVLSRDDVITIIGGHEGVVAALRQRFGLTRLQLHVPPMGYDRNEPARLAAIEFVRQNPARIVFLATGSPRSERLMADIARAEATTGTGIVVGSGLLFAAGMTRRAPLWMRQVGLEWLHRAFTEPRRLIPRYAQDLLPLLRLAWAAKHRR